MAGAGQHMCRLPAEVQESLRTTSLQQAVQMSMGVTVLCQHYTSKPDGGACSV